MEEIPSLIQTVKSMSRRITCFIISREGDSRKGDIKGELDGTVNTGAQHYSTCALKGIKEWLESTNGINVVTPKLKNLKSYDFMKTT